MFFRKSSNEERLGCLFGFLGSIAGLFAGAHSFSLYAKKIHETDPGRAICGLPAVAGMFWGAVFCGIFGMVFGMIFCQLVGYWYGKGEDSNESQDSPEPIQIISRDDAHEYCGRGLAWYGIGEIDKAINDFTKAIRGDPEDFLAYVYRAVAWEKAGNFGNALSDYKEILRLNPVKMWAYNQIAWLKATCPIERYRNGKEAVEYGTKACELTDWKAWRCLKTLAAACAETGDFLNAIKWQEKGIELTPEEEKKDAFRCLELYRSNKPFREQR